MNEAYESGSLEKTLVDELLEAMYPLCEPVHVISGSGWGWFLDPETSTMSRVMRGTEIIPISEESDESDRILVESPFGRLMIPEDEVSEIGWN